MEDSGENKAFLPSAATGKTTTTSFRTPPRAHTRVVPTHRCAASSADLEGLLGPAPRILSTSPVFLPDPARSTVLISGGECVPLGR